MKTSEARKLINKEFTKLMGFKSAINSDYAFLSVGVKAGQITAKDAAKRAYEGSKF
tara:strand:- start:223 stop:390 length:168 start_codon:yes stop_codon:yes gene_type:complete